MDVIVPKAVLPSQLQRDRVAAEDRIKHLTHIMVLNRTDRDYYNELGDELRQTKAALANIVAQLKALGK